MLTAAPAFGQSADDQSAAPLAVDETVATPPTARAPQVRQPRRAPPANRPPPRTADLDTPGAGENDDQSKLGKACRRDPQRITSVKTDLKGRMAYAKDLSQLIRTCARELNQELQQFDTAGDDAKVWDNIDQKLRKVIQTIQGAINDIYSHRGLIDQTRLEQEQYSINLTRINALYPSKSERDLRRKELEQRIANAKTVEKSLDALAKKFNDQLLKLVDLRPKFAFQLMIGGGSLQLGELKRMVQDLRRSSRNLEQSFIRIKPAGSNASQ
ncbi:MAG: hypothetical protein AAFR04_14355 [Pseudomonadota bacterium]